MPNSRIVDIYGHLKFFICYFHKYTNTFTLLSKFVVIYISRYISPLFSPKQLFCSTLSLHHIYLRHVVVYIINPLWENNLQYVWNTLSIAQLISIWLQIFWIANFLFTEKLQPPLTNAQHYENNPTKASRL